MAGSIDRRGIQAVLDGYDMGHNQSNSAKYSVWQGNKLKFVYPGNNYDDGVDLLTQNLTYIQLSQSNATYEIRFHKSCEKDNMISDKTPYYSSFNFKIFDEFGHSQNGNGTTNNYLMNRIEKLEQQLQEKSISGVEEDGLGSKEKFVLELLENPLVAGIGSALVNFLTSGKANVNPRSQTMAGTDSGVTVIGKENMQTQAELCRQAIDILYPIDKNIGTHLMKLARMAENNVSTYWMAINMLKGND